MKLIRFTIAQIKAVLKWIIKEPPFLFILLVVVLFAYGFISIVGMLIAPLAYKIGIPTDTDNVKIGVIYVLSAYLAIALYRGIKSIVKNLRESWATFQ